MTAPELEPFADRRLRFAAALGDAIAVVPGAQEVRRNGDVNYEFRQSSDFFFLTGFDEPDAVAVINPAHAKERYVLFVRPRRSGTAGARGSRAPSRRTAPTRRTRSTCSTRSSAST